MNILILKIPYIKKERDDIKNGIDEIIDSAFYTMGDKVKEFEGKFAKLVGKNLDYIVKSINKTIETLER